MSNKYTLPLKDVVNIHLNVSARAAARNAFNLCLLMGDIGSNVDFGEARIRTYTSTDEMLQDGFTLTDTLYKAAALVFGQSKVPPKVAIGRTLTKTSGYTQEMVDAALRILEKEAAPAVGAAFLSFFKRWDDDDGDGKSDYEQKEGNKDESIHQPRP